MSKEETEVKVEISKEQARKWEEKLFQKELVRARKSLERAKTSVKNAKMRVEHWEGRCNSK